MTNDTEKNNAPSETVHIRMPLGDIDVLDRLAEDLRRSRSWVALECIRLGLPKLREDAKRIMGEE